MKTLAHPRHAEEIRRRLKAVRPESAAQWGRMTAPQMVCHLTDALRMASGSKDVSPAAGVVQRTLVKWVALYVPVPWPADIQTRPELDQQCGGTTPTEFLRDVEQLETLLAEVRGRRGGFPPHPIFGRLSQWQWMRWAYLHADHHLRQFGV